ncbi:hypothetical protein BGX28_002687 [Mortierella sp. GBA30]|nr:hypothetical protein BGX28_002687 [Mortierella sp. GBA30]
MWQDEEDSRISILSSSSTPFLPATDSEPSSPRPSATLPSAALPTTFSARPAYTIGTRSHSYATDKRKSLPPPPPLPVSIPVSDSDHPSLASFSEVDDSAPMSSPSSPLTNSTGVSRTPKLQRIISPSSSAAASVAGSDADANDTNAAGLSLPSTGAAATSAGSSLNRQSSLSLNRHSSLSKKQSKQLQDRDLSVPPSPSSTHRPQKHVMLNRRSTSQDFQLRLHQQQQRQEDLGEELSEAGEDQTPGTPTSISSFGSGMALSGSERDREKSLSGRSKRLSRSSIALIESRNIQTLSSNLAMVSSPTESEFPQQNSDALLSVIAQKEARIAQLREDLETNLSELTQLKERWSQMMIEERNRQQAEASATIQEQEKQLYGHSSQSVSHRLSTTGAGIWGTVVGSVSGISGVSGGISLHQINTAHHHQQQQQSSTASNNATGLASGRSSTSSNQGRGGEGQGMSGSSRPTSPLPAYLNGFSSLNGLNTPVSPVSASTRKGDRASLSSLSTCSSSQSNASDGLTSFEAGHSSQSSFSSAGQPDQSALQLQLQKEQREARKLRRESTGLFIPPEAEEVLVNTGKALFKGFGSLLGGIRTVVSDVADSDRFQHSRQRTMDMVSGLAQTAADALPLPSHDDIYYHHQRLRLLDEDEEQNPSAEQLQQAKEQRRKERQKEKGRRLLEKESIGSIEQSASVSRASSLVRRISRAKKDQSKTMATDGSLSDSQTIAVGSISGQVSQLSIRDEFADNNKGTDRSDGVTDEDEEVGWDIEDKELLESLEAEVLDQAKVSDEKDKMDHRNGSSIDTPVRNTLESSTAYNLASKKND